MNIKYMSLLSFLCVAGTNFCNYQARETQNLKYLQKTKGHNSLNQEYHAIKNEKYTPYIPSEEKAFQEMQDTYKKSHPQELRNKILIDKIPHAYDEYQSLQDLTDTGTLQRIADAYEQSFQDLKTYDQNNKTNPQLFEALYKHFCLKNMIEAAENKQFPTLNRSLHGGLYDAFFRHGGNQGLQKDSMGRECSYQACSLVPFFISSAPMMLEVKKSNIFPNSFTKTKMFDRVHAECMELFDPEDLKEKQVAQAALRDLYKNGPRH